MKTIILFTFLFIVLFIFSGCAVMGELIVAMILPPPYPPPPPDEDVQIIIIDQPSTSPREYKHRDTHTGRGSLYQSSSPTENRDTNKETRDSGVQRSGHMDSNPAPVKNNDTHIGTRNSGAQRGRH
jgi:hypothetical protein